MQQLPPEPIKLVPGAEGVDDTEYLTLRGAIWPLRLDMATCARFERATGVNMLKNWHVLDLQRMSISALQALLWAAMSQVEPSLTLDDVGRMIRPGDFERIGEAVNHMVLKGIPPEEPPIEVSEEKKTTAS
jgi:hypothetical protein